MNANLFVWGVCVIVVMGVVCELVMGLCVYLYVYGYLYACFCQCVHVEFM